MAVTRQDVAKRFSRPGIRLSGHVEVLNRDCPLDRSPGDVAGTGVGAEDEVAVAVGDVVERDRSQRLDELGAALRADGVLDAAVDHGPVADPERARALAGDGQLELALGYDHHLLCVLVRMRLDTEARVVVHAADEHLLPADRVDVHARDELVQRNAVPGPERRVGHYASTTRRTGASGCANAA